MRVTKGKLENLISWANKREQADDHLDRNERLSVIHAYKAINPNEVLSDDVDEAFVSIIN